MQSWRSYVLPTIDMQSTMMHALLLAVAMSTVVNAQTYRMTTSSTLVPLSSVHPGTEWTVSDVSLVDDGPLQSVPLQFSFPWFERLETSVLLDPNGALRFPPNEACLFNETSFVFLSSDCFFNVPSAFRSLIAVLVTDLDPGVMSVKTGVKYRSSANAFTMAFDQVPLFFFPNENRTGEPLYSFTVTIQSSGSIIIRYEQAVDPRTVNGYQGTRPVMAGLRHRLGTPSPGAAGVFGTNADGVNNPNVGDWPSTVLAGQYIPRASAITGSTVTYEPVAFQACLSPRFGPLQGTNTLYVTVSPYLMNNVVAIQFFCVFGSPEYARTRASIVGNRPSTFSCAAPAKPMNVPVTVPMVFTAVYNNVTLYAIPNGLSDAFQQANLTFTYVSDTDPRVVNVAVYTNATVNNATVFCDSCAYLASTYCVKDCANTWRGTAAVDTCQECTGGTTGKTANNAVDCFGVCFGPASFIANSAICVCQSYNGSSGGAPGTNSSQCANFSGLLPGEAPLPHGATFCVTPRFAVWQPNVKITIRTTSLALQAVLTTFSETATSVNLPTSKVKFTCLFARTFNTSATYLAGSGPTSTQGSRLECIVPQNISGQNLINFTVPVSIVYVITELAVNNTRQIPTNPLYFTYILASDERASALTSQSASVDYVCNDCLRVAGCARDCNGTWNGINRVDECDRCRDPGAPGPAVPIDCAGICSGPFTTVPRDGVNQCICTNCTALLQTERDKLQRRQTGDRTPAVRAAVTELYVDVTAERAGAIVPQGLSAADTFQYFFAAGSAATGSIPSASTAAPSTQTQASEPAGAFSVVATAPVQLFSNATAFNLTDVAFEPIELPFAFQFFGFTYRRLYVNPYGALQFSLSDRRVPSTLWPSSPPGSIPLNPAATPNFTQATVWQNFVAGLMAPFNLTLLHPGVSASSKLPRLASTIYYVSSATHLTVVYSKMTVTPAEDPSGASDQRFTFAITLRSSGSTSVTFSSDSAAGTALSTAPVVGVRPPSPNVVAPMFIQDISKAPPASAASTVSLAATLIVPNSSFDFCSITSYVCMYPRVSKAAGGSLIYLALPSNPGSCLDFLSPANGAEPLARVNCSFGGVATLGTFDPLQSVITCLTPPGTVNTTVLLSLELYVRRMVPLNAPATYVKSSVILLNRLDLAVTYVVDTDPSLPVSPSQPSAAFLCSNVSCLIQTPFTSAGTLCSRDCAGVIGGAAVLDDCRVCSNGTTGLVPNIRKDCRGICNGPFNDSDCGCSANVVQNGPPNQYVSSEQIFPGIPLLDLFQACIFYGAFDFSNAQEISYTVDPMSGYKVATLVGAASVALYILGIVLLRAGKSFYFRSKSRTGVFDGPSESSAIAAAEAELVGFDRLMSGHRGLELSASPSGAGGPRLAADLAPRSYLSELHQAHTANAPELPPSSQQDPVGAADHNGAVTSTSPQARDGVESVEVSEAESEVELPQHTARDADRT